jgi:hypothetical protein
VPRENHYYYLGGSNLMNISDQTRSNQDYAQPNRVDGLLGFVWGPLDFAVGSIRSAGGFRATVTPFYNHPIGSKLSLVAQGYDFGRNRTFNSKKFDKPVWDFGFMARINKFFGIGGRVEDVKMIKRYQTWANVTFEDKDLGYLFGIATFGAAGAKGRSKKSN